MHTCKYIYTYLYMHPTRGQSISIHPRIYLSIHNYVCIQIHMHMNKKLMTYTSQPTNLSYERYRAFTRALIHTLTYTYTYTYTHTHRYTRTHTHKRTHHTDTDTNTNTNTNTDTDTDTNTNTDTHPPPPTHTHTHTLPNHLEHFPARTGKKIFCVYTHSHTRNPIHV